ncbi:MAG TPA: alpha/beta hydrolase [Vicinamibacterales bacterium]
MIVFSQRTRHVAFIVVGLVTFVVLAGVTYQSVATALERRKFPYPGRLIAVGDHQLHLHCVGAGTPTVVLEAPAAGMSVGWTWVQDEVAKATRVCSYDRAGLGWSEAGEDGYRAARVPDELHTLLERAAERGPFVIVGHELGASYARMYASRFRDQTAALVLVDDPSNSTETARYRVPRLVRAWPWLARIGVLRATRTLSRHASGFPGESAGATRAFLNRPDHLARGALEIRRRQETARDAAAEPLDPALPVTQVSVSEDEPPALLDSADRAREVTRAIEQTVKRLRR